MTNTGTRAELSEINGLSLKDVVVMPHACELSRWREEGLIEVDVERSVFRLTTAGQSRLKKCCATCGSWKQIDLPKAAGGPVGECHHEERLDGMRRLRPDRTYYYESCEVHWDR